MLYTYISYEKHYMKDVNEYVETISSESKREITSMINLISSGFAMKKDFFYSINKIALQRLQRDENLTLEKLKEDLALEYHFPNIEIDLFLINKELIIYDATYKKDIGFDLSTITDTKYYIEKINADNDIEFVKNASYHSLDKKFKQYTLAKLKNDVYLEMAFTDTSNISSQFANYNGNIKIFRISWDFDSMWYYEISKVIEYDTKKEQYKHIKKFPNEMPTDDPIINTSRNKGSIKVQNGNIIKIYLPILEYKTSDLLDTTDMVLEVSVDIGDKLKTLEEFKNIFILLAFLLFFLFVAMFFWIRQNITEPTDVIANAIKNSNFIENASLTNKRDELGVIANEYNSLLKLLNTEIAKNRQFLEDNKRFISDTVHQIRTPLSVILMNTDLIQMHQTDNRSDEFIEQISASINMLTNSYEDFGYITSHDFIEYQPTNLCVSKILKERVDFFKTIAKVNNKSFTCDIEEECYLHINQIEFERLVDNNLSNAIKYADANKVIKVTLKKEPQNVVISFSSYANAIKNPSRIFEKNYRENEEKRGLGLGMNMVKNICIKYGVKYELFYKNNQNIFTYTFKI